MADPIKILIVDDHPMFRFGVKASLSQAPDMLVVGEAENSAQAMILIEETQPDIVLLDLVMPETKPEELAEWVASNHVKTKIIVLTSMDEDAFLVKMMKAGAVGYVNKSHISATLLDSVRKIVHGGTAYEREQFERAAEWETSTGFILEQITRRERDVINLIAQGYGNNEIADTMSVSVRTVEAHISSILQKVGVNSRAQLMVWASKNLKE